MSWTTKIEEWANWTAEQLRDENCIPSPRYWRADVPWFNDFLDLLGEDGPPADLERAFRERMQGTHAFPARFVGLDLYHRLEHQDAYPTVDELVRDARDQAAAEFRWLLEANPVAQILPDRRHLDWELRLCCPLHMWDRADALLEKLGDVMPGADAKTVRAQHVFLRRYWVADDDPRVGADFDDILWESEVFSRTSSPALPVLNLRAALFELPLSTASPPAPEMVHAFGAINVFVGQAAEGGRRRCGITPPSVVSIAAGHAPAVRPARVRAAAHERAHSEACDARPIRLHPVSKAIAKRSSGRRKAPQKSPKQLGIGEHLSQGQGPRD